jgi:hypothetical protein
VWLVSKCGPKVQERTLRWLDGRDFYRPDRAGPGARPVLPAAAGEADPLRAAAADRTSWTTAPDVHEAIRGVVQHHYLFGPQPHGVPDYAQHARDVDGGGRLILSTLD